MNKHSRRQIALALRQAARVLASSSRAKEQDAIDLIVSYVMHNVDRLRSRADLEALLEETEVVDAEEVFEAMGDTRQMSFLSDLPPPDAFIKVVNDTLTQAFSAALDKIDEIVEKQAAFEGHDIERWVEDGIARFYDIPSLLSRLQNDEVKEVVKEAIENGVATEDLFAALESTGEVTDSGMDLAAYNNDSDFEGEVYTEATVFRGRLGDLTISDISRLFKETASLFDTKKARAHHGFDPTRNYNTFNFTVTVGWKFDADKVREALEEHLPIEETDEPPETVYKFKNGFRVVSLKPGHLFKEGCEGGICIGQRRRGYYDALKNGEIAVYSLRSPSDKVKLTIEVDLHEDGRPKAVLQVKGKANRLPGFDLGRTEFKHVDEVEMAMEFVSRYLKLDPMDAHDLAPGVTALAEWKEQEAERRARQKAEHAARRVQGSVSFAPSIAVRRLLARATKYNLRLEAERG